MEHNWTEISKIRSVDQLEAIWQDLNENDQYKFQIEVLRYAWNQVNNIKTDINETHTDFIHWCKCKYNRYKYSDAKFKSNFKHWFKNLCYFIHFYLLVLSVAEGTELNNGGLIWQTTNVKRT